MALVPSTDSSFPTARGEEEDTSQQDVRPPTLCPTRPTMPDSRSQMTPASTTTTSSSVIIMNGIPMLATEKNNDNNLGMHTANSNHDSQENDNDNRNDRVVSPVTPSDVSIDEESDEEDSDDDDDDDDDDDNDDDEDDDDEEEEDDHSGQDVPAGIMEFLRALTNHELPEDDDDDDDDDDEDDDDSDCNCPHCWMAHFGLNDEDDLCTGSDCDEDNILDPVATPCAICMEPETSRRTFARLPCCGGTLVDSTTSTRFCQPCVIQYMARNGNGVPPDTTNSNSNSTSKCASSKSASSLVGECPRCKRLLVLTETKSTTTTTTTTTTTPRSQEKKKIPFCQRAQLVPANAQQCYWYIGRMDGGHYRVYLLTLAWCDAHFVPEELLLNDSSSADRIAHLCQWGILEKVKFINNNNNNNTPCGSAFWRLQTMRLADQLHNLLHRLLPSVIADPKRTNLPNQSGAVYKLSPVFQMELRNLLVKHLEMDEDWGLRLSRADVDEPENNGKQSFMVACNCAASAFMAISKLRVGRAVRLLNRGLTLALCSFKSSLPNVTKWPSDLPTHDRCWHAATALNVILVYFLLQILAKALWIAFYLFKAFCVCQLLGAYFVPPEQPWKRRIRDATLFALFAYSVMIPLLAWCRPWTVAEDVVSISIPNDDDGTIQSMLIKTAPMVVVGQEL